MAKPETPILDEKEKKNAELKKQLEDGGDTFNLICDTKPNSRDWMKAMEVGDEVVVQVSVQQLNPDGTSAVVEAINIVPHAKIVDEFDKDGNVIGKLIVRVPE